MTNLDDTQPNPVITNEIPAPPRFLLWGIIGLFIMGIIGTLVGIYGFREVLKPSQQQRVINNLPFMDAFLPQGEALPTAEPVDQDALDSLLSSPLVISTPEPTNTDVIDVTEEATQEIITIEDITTEPTEEVTEEAFDTTSENVVAQISTETATLPPTITATIEPIQPTPAPQTSNRPSNHINTGFVWDQQDWNNCGPTNVTMALTFYGWTRDQDYAASIIRPEREDKNVSPHELVSFVNDYTDLEALWRIGGDMDILRELIANEIPVIVEAGSMPEGYEWIGHYQTIAGYDDAQQIIYLHDTFLGANTDNGLIIEDYNTFDNNWQHFNRTFIPIFEPNRTQLVMDILGTRAEPLSAAEHAYNVAREEATANPRDGFAFFNMGTALTMLERYEDASTLFDQSTRLEIPRRMLWYQFGIFEAYFNVGRYEDVLSFVDVNLANGAEYVEETYYWQGRVYAMQGRTQDAITAFRTALQRNRNYTAAQEALDEITS